MERRIHYVPVSQTYEVFEWPEDRAESSIGDRVATVTEERLIEIIMNHVREGCCRVMLKEFIEYYDDLGYIDLHGDITAETEIEEFENHLKKK